MTEIPQQNLPLSKKNKEWRQQCVDAYIDMANLDQDSFRDLMKYYDAANGHLHEEDYRYVTNPYQTSDTAEGKKKQFPSRLRNYDILGNVLGVLLGERRKRPFNHMVTITNSDSVSRYKMAEKQFADQQLQQILVNTLEQYGFDTGEEKKEVDDLQSVMKKFRNEWKDERAIQGQHALEYIKNEQEVFDKTQEGWADFLKAGKAFSYRGVLYNDPHYQIIAPWNIDFGGGEDIKFVEDCDWVVCKRDMHKSQILEVLWKEIQEADGINIDDLNKAEDNSSGATYGSSIYDSLQREYDDGRTIPVHHVCWKSMKKIGILTYEDEFGVEQQLEVDEDFKPREGDNVEWYWVNEVWEGYKIDNKYYLGIQPLPIQRESVSNKAECKLPYNGVLAVDRGSHNISLIQKGYPYQVLYNIYHYRLEWGIAKNKGKIAMMDISLFPDKDGWEIEDSFYFMDTMNMLLFDGAKAANQQSVLQALKDIDLSFHEFISSHIELLNQIKAEWEEMAGISRQRKGDVSPYAGKSATEQAVYNSATITEEMFARYESFVRRDLQALLDYSKISWVEGKQINYIGDDMIPNFWDIDPIEHMESEYGLYVSNSVDDQNKFQTLQEVIPTFVQNNVSPDLIAEMIDADNFPSLKQKLSEANEEYQKQLQKQQKAQQQQEMMQYKDNQRQREHEARQNELDRESQEYQTFIKAKTDLAKQDKSDEAQDIRQVEQDEKEREQELEENSLEREKMQMEQSQQQQENMLEREKMRHEEKIEKLKLANPTTGENLNKTQQTKKEITNNANN